MCGMMHVTRRKRINENSRNLEERNEVIRTEMKRNKTRRQKAHLDNKMARSSVAVAAQRDTPAKTATRETRFHEISGQ